MSMHCVSQRPVYSVLVVLVLAALVLTACSSGEPPASATLAPKLPPTFKMNVAVPDTLEEGSMVRLPERESAAISINIEPYEQLVWTWEVSGTSGGSLNTTQGENVIYTAGTAGIDTVTARATMGDGTAVKQSVDINVEPPATATPLPTETALPPKVTLENLQDNQKVPCSNLVGGTFPAGLDKAIWPVVFVGGVYHPQDEGGKAAQKANGRWFQTVRFGDCVNAPKKDIGQPFHLIIVTANESANAAFELYIANGKQTGKWPGMPALPEGAEEQVRVVVIRE
jgi:hypothetical protein